MSHYPMPKDRLRLHMTNLTSRCCIWQQGRDAAHARVRTLLHYCITASRSCDTARARARALGESVRRRRGPARRGQLVG
eukprot:597639-Pleurochrysis_carterae.AAC.3